MSQRRSGGAATEKPAVEIVNEPGRKPVHGGSLSLDNDAADGAVDSSEMEPLSVEDRYKEERKQSRIKRWKESPFACGLTEATWEEERNHRRDHYSDLPRDDTGCVCCSAMVCPLFNAGRVGNMAVLHSTTEWVEEVTEDEETGESSSKRYTRPRLNIVVGPYWPMLMFVTYPLIFGTSWFAMKNLFLSSEAKPPLLIVIWTTMTLTLIIALACTGCRDPGIMYRYENPPPQHENTWRWNDQAQTYRPRGAYFDSDTMVVVEEFDHTYVHCLS